MSKYTPAPETLRDLTQQERAAMWLYHNEYAAQACGAIAFYAGLSKSEKRNVQEMIDDIMALAPTKEEGK